MASLFDEIRERQRAEQLKAEVENRSLLAQKQEALDEVMAAARHAANRLSSLPVRWPGARSGDIYGEKWVVIHIGMPKPLYLGKDDNNEVKIFKKVGSGLDPFDPEFIVAPLLQRKKPSDIRHIIKFLDRLGV
ncbi:MAG: hypothetical protein ABIR46_01035 [Candidatus Saccharimonadales bacterium]